MTKKSKKNSEKKTANGTAKSRRTSVINKISIASKSRKKGKDKSETEDESQDINEFKDECLEKILHLRERKDDVINYLRFDKNISLPYMRGPMNDFTYILASNYQAELLTSVVYDSMKDAADPNRQETLATRKVETDIKNDCKKNYQDNNICYCCGYSIKKNQSKQCDHFIPLIQMAASVTAGTCGNNLHFIHTACNSKKKNNSLIHLWNHCGTSFYNVTRNNNERKQKARKRIIEILNTITFVDDYQYRSNVFVIQYYKNRVSKLINEMKVDFDKIAQANLMLNISQAVNPKDLAESRDLDGSKDFNRKINTLVTILEENVPSQGEGLKKRKKKYTRKVIKNKKRKQRRSIKK